MKNRFIKTFSQTDSNGFGASSTTEIWIDGETGVNYLYHTKNTPPGAGLTVLVDINGRPVITPVEYL